MRMTFGIGITIFNPFLEALSTEQGGGVPMTYWYGIPESSLSDPPRGRGRTGAGLLNTAELGISGPDLDFPGNCYSLDHATCQGVFVLARLLPLKHGIKYPPQKGSPRCSAPILPRGEKWTEAEAGEEANLPRETHSG